MSKQGSKGRLDTEFLSRLHHTTYIFTKTELQELTASLVATIGVQGLNELPKVECTSTYPY